MKLILSLQPDLSSLQKMQPLISQAQLSEASLETSF